MLDLEKLQQQCETLTLITARIIQNSQRLSHSSYCLFWLAHSYGFRYSDICLSEWIFSTGNRILFVTQKKTGQVRRIESPAGTTLDMEMLLKMKNEAQKLDYQAHEANFVNCQCLCRVMCGKKELKLHIFRHLYAKSVFLTSKDLLEVGRNLGTSSVKTALGYVSSHLKIIGCN